MNKNDENRQPPSSPRWLRITLYCVFVGSIVGALFGGLWLFFVLRSYYVQPVKKASDEPRHVEKVTISVSAVVKGERGLPTCVIPTTSSLTPSFTSVPKAGDYLRGFDRVSLNFSPVRSDTPKKRAVVMTENVWIASCEPFAFGGSVSSGYVLLAQPRRAVVVFEVFSRTDLLYDFRVSLFEDGPDSVRVNGSFESKTLEGSLLVREKVTSGFPVSEGTINFGQDIRKPPVTFRSSRELTDSVSW